MIITVEKLLKNVKTSKDTGELEEELQALEVSIRKATNNKFQNRNIRFTSGTTEIKTPFAKYLKIDDTLEISESEINSGLYTIKSIEGEIISLNEPIFDEEDVLFTKVEYPLDVQRGVIEVMRWKLKNEEQNYNPEAEKEVQSESISRHSVTYARDNTESNIDEDFGVPKKYLSFLRRYKKARF